MVALYAAIAMFVQDLLAVFLVMAEARNRALLAGLMDCVCWPAGMITTTITVTALQGHHAGLKAEVFAAVTVANFLGSFVAVSIGKRMIKERNTVTSVAACACGCPVAAKEAR